MEYLINVALSFVPKLVVALVIFVITSEIMRRIPKFKGTSVYKNNCFYLQIFLAICLAISMMSPSITYKHETFDADTESYQIELLNEEKHTRPGLVIEDRSRKDHSVSKEEWEAKSSYEKGESNE